MMAEQTLQSILQLTEATMMTFCFGINCDRNDSSDGIKTYY